MKISKLKEVTKKDAQEVGTLMGQLSSKKKKLSHSFIASVVESPYIEIWVLRDKDKIIGMASLITIQTLSAKSAHIEDVVVDIQYRGQGLGKLLSNKLLARARALKISHIDLTSKPTRQAANALYKKIGFEKRETNVYRLKL